MHHILLPILAIAACTVIALAAVPPLSQAERQQRAALIVRGSVNSVNSTIEQKGDDYSDRIYRIELCVDHVEKGDASLAGRAIVVTTWQPAERPDGWVGPQGQNVIPASGATVRVYLSREGDEHELLVPNGLEVLAQPSTSPATRAASPS